MSKYIPLILTSVLSVVMMLFLYSCEPVVPSLLDREKVVNRAELQLELDQIVGLAQIRMADLDKQQQIRDIIVNNALLVTQGQPFNPFGLLSAMAALYGITQGGTQVTRAVKNGITKRKNNTS